MEQAIIDRLMIGKYNKVLGIATESRPDSAEWQRLRQEVITRDEWKGYIFCEVCGLPIGHETWHLGHRVDLCVGGDNSLDNLGIMCGPCNLVVKPPHSSLQEYNDWRENQFFFRMVFAAKQFRKLPGMSQEGKEFVGRHISEVLMQEY